MNNRPTSIYLIFLISRCKYTDNQKANFDIYEPSTMSKDGLSNQINYAKAGATRPSYKHMKLTPQDGSQTVDISATGGNESIFLVPASVYNLSKSYLSFSLDLATTAPAAGLAMWSSAVGVPVIRQIQFYSRDNLMLADLKRCNNWLNTVLPYRTSQKELLAKPLTIGTAATSTGECGAIQACNRTAATNYKLDGTAGSVAYLEPKYAFTSAVVHIIHDPTVYYRIPMSEFKGSLLELNKDVYFGQQMFLRIVWAPYTDVASTADSLTDATSTAAAATIPMQVANLEFELAVENNQAVAGDIKRQVQDGSGLTLNMPFTHDFQYSLTGTSHSVLVRLNRSHGRKLRRLWLAPYNNTQGVNTRYDHTNVAAAKVSSFYSTTDTMRNQTDANINMSATDFSEYRLIADKLEGSCVAESTAYRYNWVWCEDYTDAERFIDSDYDISAGLSLDVEREYILNATTAGSIAWYAFAECERSVRISSQGISIE